MFFVAFSTLAWDEAGGAHNPAQLARALARRGHAVLYVEPQPSPQRETGGLPLEIAALTELGMTPMQLRRAWFGVPGGADEELEMLRRVWENLCARTERSGDARRIALYSAPFDPVVRLLPLLHSSGWTVVYYAMDDFAAAPALGYTQFDPRAEEYLVSRADLLAGVTPHTARTLARAGKTTHVIPNGIDLAFFRDGERGKAPVIARGALTLGFWGTVMESLVDADLIEYVARARPDWTIHLLGAVDPEPHRRSIAAQLKGLTNVHLHGRVPHSALASYAAAFDVMLAPMPDTAFTRGRDPLKVYEYLAAHKPVVAAYAPQLTNVPGVYVAWTPDEFIGAVERAARMPMDTQAVDDFLAHQSWAARAETLLALLDRIPARAAVAAPPAPAPAAPLATFIQLDLNAALRYAAALENELDAVQAWARELEASLQARSRRSRWLSLKTRGVKTRAADAPHRSSRANDWESPDLSQTVDVERELADLRERVRRTPAPPTDADLTALQKAIAYVNAYWHISAALPPPAANAPLSWRIVYRVKRAARRVMVELLNTLVQQQNSFNLQVARALTELAAQENKLREMEKRIAELEARLETKG